MLSRHEICLDYLVAHRRPQRLANFDYLGSHRYFVTCCVAERGKAFTSSDRVQIVRVQILRTCSERQFEEIASVYMPDHVHFLVRGMAEGAAFVPFMTLLRQRTAVAYSELTAEMLWQDGYFDRVLRPSDDTCQWVDYILKNPVRAGLVERAEDYPYSFSHT